MPDLLGRLREETRDAHEALEASNLVLPATKSVERYRQLIGAMYAFHRSYESGLADFEEQFRGFGLDVRKTYKRDALNEEALELESPSFNEPKLRINDVNAAAGALYVMEGSTLGGAMLGKAIFENLRITSRYYGIYGSATAVRWRETCETLRRMSSAERDASIVCAANQTFSAMRLHLSASSVASISSDVL